MDEKSAGPAELFPELPAPGFRQFEITASLEGRPSPSMHIVVPESDIEAAFGMAFDACLETPAFELKIRPLKGVARP